MHMYRVLVVDSYTDGAELMCVLVAHLGHACRIATSSSEALHEAAEFLPDVVILDLGIPYTAGLELARALRRLLGRRRLYLAALTSAGDPRVPVAAREAGCNIHPLKPGDTELVPGIMRLAARRFAEEVVPRVDG